MTGRPTFNWTTGSPVFPPKAAWWQKEHPRVKTKCQEMQTTAMGIPSLDLSHR